MDDLIRAVARLALEDADFRFAAGVELGLDDAQLDALSEELKED